MTVSRHTSLATMFAVMYKKRMTDSLQIWCVRGINCVVEGEDMLLTFNTLYIKVNRITPILASPTVSWCLPLDMGSWNFTILQVCNFNRKSSLKSDYRLEKVGHTSPTLTSKSKMAALSIKGCQGSSIYCLLALLSFLCLVPSVSKFYSSCASVFVGTKCNFMRFDQLVTS